WLCHNNTDESKQKLPALLMARVPGYAWDQPWTGRVGVTGLECVAAALAAVVAHNSLSAILTCCVEYGGDVDTVAAIAMAAASGSREVEQNLPGHLVEGLENGGYGRDYLVKLDQRLHEVVTSP
ncbi:MAG: ADP-ribosylglycohydrolase, partial [Planctomycetaceae bacterium]|nr:ADP-ribosylglycohydrolase [Planctomycetaceae bacterium]